MKQRLHLASCPQRRTFALASGIKTVRLWNLETRLFHMDEPPVELPYSLEFDTGHTGIIGLMLLDEETLVCAHGDGCVQMWAIESPELLDDAKPELSNYEPGRHVMAVGQLVVPQSSTLTSHSSDTLGVRLLWTLDVGARLNTCAFWHGGDHLRCALGGTSGQMFWVELGRHRAPNGRRLGQVGSSIVLATISARGDRVATASRDRKVAIWRPREEIKVDEATGAWRIFDDAGGEIWALAFSHSGRYLAGGAIDNGVYMWDTRAKKALRAVSHDHRGWISDLVWSEDDRLLACASWDNTVGLFRSIDLEPLYCFDYHQDYVSQVAFVPSSTLLISAGYDRRVAIWDWREATLVREYREHDDWIQALSWVGAGLFLTASSDGIARVWSSNTLRCEAVLEQRRVQSWFDTGLDDSSLHHSGGFRSVRPDAPIAIDATLRGALESSMVGLGDEVSLFMDEPLAPLIPKRTEPAPEPAPAPAPAPAAASSSASEEGEEGEEDVVQAPEARTEAAGLFEIAPPSDSNDFARGGGSGEIMAFGVIATGERLPFSVSKSGLLDLQETSLAVEVGGGKLQTTSELMFDSSASHTPEPEPAPRDALAGALPDAPAPEPTPASPDLAPEREADVVDEVSEADVARADVVDPPSEPSELEHGDESVPKDEEDELLDEAVEEQVAEELDGLGSLDDGGAFASRAADEPSAPSEAVEVSEASDASFEPLPDEVEGSQAPPEPEPAEPEPASEPASLIERSQADGPDVEAVDAVEPGDDMDEESEGESLVEYDVGTGEASVEPEATPQPEPELEPSGDKSKDEPTTKLSRDKLKALFRRHLSQASDAEVEEASSEPEPVARTFDSFSSSADDSGHDLSLFDDISEHIEESIAQLADPNTRSPVEEFEESAEPAAKASSVVSDVGEEPSEELEVGASPEPMMADEVSAHDLETVEYTPDLAPVRSNETAKYVAPTRVGASDLMTELAKQSQAIQRESVVSELSLSRSGASDDIWSELSEDFPSVADALAEESFVSLSVSNDLSAESIAELEPLEPNKAIEHASSSDSFGDDAGADDDVEERDASEASLGEEPSEDSELLEELSIPEESEPRASEPPPRPVIARAAEPEALPAVEDVTTFDDAGSSSASAPVSDPMSVNFVDVTPPSEAESWSEPREEPLGADSVVSDATAESEPAAEMLAQDIARAARAEDPIVAPPGEPAEEVARGQDVSEPHPSSGRWLDDEDSDADDFSEVDQGGVSSGGFEDRVEGEDGLIAFAPGAAISSHAEDSEPEFVTRGNPYMQDPDSDSTPFGMIMMPAEPEPKPAPEPVTFDEQPGSTGGGVGELSSVPRELDAPTETEPPPLSMKSTLMGVSPPRDLVVKSLRAKLKKARARDEQEGPRSEPAESPSARSDTSDASDASDEERDPRQTIFGAPASEVERAGSDVSEVSAPQPPSGHAEPSDPEATRVVKKPTLADLRRYASAENSVASEVSLDRPSVSEATPGKKLSQTLEQPIVFTPSRGGSAASEASEPSEPTKREGSMFKTLSGTNPRVKPIAGDNSPLPNPGREALDIATPFGGGEVISANQTMIGGLVYRPSEPPPAVDAPSAADTDASFPEVSEVVSEPEFTEHTPALIDLSIPEIWQMRLAENRPAMKIFKRRHGQPQNWRSWDRKEVGLGRVYGVSALGERNLFAVSGARRHIEIWSEKRGLIARLPSAGRTVHALCSMADGRVVVSGDDRAKLTVWLLPKALKPNDDSSVIRGTLEGHVAPISYVCADRNGKMLLSTSLDGTARIWSMEDGACISVMDHRGEPLSAADFWARGFVTVSHEGNMRLWDIRGVQIDQVSANSPLTCVVSHRGKVYFGCQDGAVVEYFRGRTKTLTRHADIVTGLSLSNEGVLASVSASGELFIHGEDGVDTELDVGEALSGVSFGTGMIVAGTMSGDVEIFKKR